MKYIKAYENKTSNVKDFDPKYINGCANYIMQMCGLVEDNDGFVQWAKSISKDHVTYYFIYLEEVYEKLVNFSNSNNIFNVVRKGEIFPNTIDVVLVIYKENVIEFGELYLNINKYNI